ncbi:2-phospho-L-lactate guanylyltransferase [Halomarina oriensis]|uniref:2-phospho-L-lactate guanylyltransferase n=1 Tax=Halomarina oriensis TaxID=671145 RepID=A0A6B0GQY7_9EURY|nr:2-phospho-L-lactate guanylyltransferase [Halomarina oriensis]MWG34078.1 2-phospho-L-lactate guanylyltransferase [Halomarina oriensis]
MHAVVPYRVADPKTRLAPVLSPAERGTLSRAMLADVLDAVAATGHETTVLATEPLAVPGDTTHTVRVDDRPLTPAVDAVLAEHAGPDSPVAVVMADLALATPDALSGLFAADGEVVFAPGRGGGTNALVSRRPDFRTDYHGASYRDHRRGCERLGVSPTTVDSYRLGTDVDDPADLVEVLLHAPTDGRTRQFLAERFTLATGEGRVSVDRRE